MKLSHKILFKIWGQQIYLEEKLTLDLLSLSNKTVPNLLQLFQEEDIKAHQEEEWEVNKVLMVMP
jgi:hypothetical protein